MSKPPPKRRGPPTTATALTAAIQALERRALDPVDGASTSAFRILFGIIGLTAVARFFAYGWINALYLAPAHHFTYPGFAWVQPWPGWGMYAHFAALGLLSIGIAAGYRWRWCAALFAVGFTYVELLDQTTYLNHYYLVSLLALLLAVLPLDGRTVPRWAYWTLRFQVGVVYGFAGLAKLNPDWLLQALPLRIWLYQHSDLPAAGPLLAAPAAAYAMSWAGALFDLAIVPALLWRRTRIRAYAALALFHLLTGLLFPQLGIFPWLMTAGALIFFDPDWPQRLRDRILRRRNVPRPDIPRLDVVRPNVALRDVLRPDIARRDVAQPDTARPDAARQDVACPNVPTPDIARPDAARPDVPRPRVARPNSPGPHTPPSRRPALPTRFPRPTRAAIIVLTLFIILQIALPLRHYAYPGNVRWNEQGYRFAWRVMLSEKTGFVQYRVRCPDTGQSWLVFPDAYLTPIQTERMAIQPDLILQTAHLIAADYAAPGCPGVAVHADAHVAFNGRPNARLIDPDVDLAAIKPGLAPKHWILPYADGTGEDGYAGR